MLIMPYKVFPFILALQVNTGTVDSLVPKRAPEPDQTLYLL